MRRGDRPVWVTALCLVAGAALGPTSIQAQGLPGEPPGISAGELVDRIDALAEETLRQTPVAGLAIAVKRGEDPVLMKGYGLADLEHRVPVTVETVFRIGSLTKQVTAAAVMQLVEDGALRLDDLLTDHIPDYDTQGHDIDLRQLLGHTSGIRSYTNLGDAFWGRAGLLDLTHDEMRNLFEGEPFDFAPGEAYAYNNSGYYLLGMIIERATGMGYDEYLGTHVFDPLGMSRSSYCHETTIIPGRAEGYRIVGGRLVNDVHVSMNTPGAAGALCSTLPDLLIWTSSLRNGRVVSESSFDAMTTPGRLNDGSETSYGFGLRLDPLDGHQRIWHTGGINGFRVVMSHYPEYGVDIIVLSNTEGNHPMAVSDQIARWVLEPAPRR